jgi:DNA-binding MarR family transcriptional regulator
MKPDAIEEKLSQWARERPDLDPAGMKVVSRILLLSQHLKRNAARSLGKRGLNLWAYDVLATLRRQGEPYHLSPTELSRAVMLSPAAMTNRLDRLEDNGLIERHPDPDDRRALLIALTPAGREMADIAVTSRFEEAAKTVDCLTETEREQLTALLKKLLKPRKSRPKKPMKTSG